MKINEIIWPEERINHIANHNITPEEVEEICFSNAFIQKAKSKGKNPVIIYVDKQCQADIYFVLLFNYLVAKDILLLLAQ